MTDLSRIYQQNLEHIDEILSGDIEAQVNEMGGAETLRDDIKRELSVIRLSLDGPGAANGTGLSWRLAMLAAWESRNHRFLDS